MNSLKGQPSEVKVRVGDVSLDGDLTVPDQASGLVLFAHGSGSSRKSPRNRFVAEELNHASLATLLFDLLTPDEESVDMVTRELRFDIPLLAERLMGAIDWSRKQSQVAQLPIALFGASTGAAAALIAAAKKPDEVGAVVSRGGRPDLAGEFLPDVQAPTLLIVGGDDEPVIGMNERARDRMSAPCELVVVPGATHLFEEPGKLEEVAHLASTFFGEHLTGH